MTGEGYRRILRTVFQIGSLCVGIQESTGSRKLEKRFYIKLEKRRSDDI